MQRRRGITPALLASTSLGLRRPSSTPTPSKCRCGERASAEQEGTKQDRSGSGRLMTFGEFIDELKKFNKSDADDFEARANNFASSAASSSSMAPPPQQRGLPAHERMEPFIPPQRRPQTWAQGPPQSDEKMPPPPVKKVRLSVDERATGDRSGGQTTDSSKRRGSGRRRAATPTVPSYARRRS